MSEYDPKAWESIELEKLYSEVGWSNNRLHTIILLQQYSEKDFLDVGCLDGAYIGYLRDLGYDGKYFGVDVTKRHIEVARKNLPKEKFRQDDARKLSFKSRSFPTVLFSDVIQHLPDPKKPLSEVCRVADKYVLLSTYGSRTHTFTRHNDKFMNTYYTREDIESIVPEEFEVLEFFDLAHPSLNDDSNIRIYHFVLRRRDV